MDRDISNSLRIDEIYETNSLVKPRTYQKCARKDYLRLAKSKKRTRRAIRKVIGKQLRHIRRDIRYVVEFVQNIVKLTQRQKDRMNLVTTVYEQQRLMYESRIHSIPRRIVSLSQPWARPIVRGEISRKHRVWSQAPYQLVERLYPH